MIDITGIEENPKVGYFKVGDRIFYSKPQAYVYATEVGIDPVWNFNAAKFAGLNWTVMPETSIRDLYRLRAQQLRDRYDYIRLECSGGADSTTAAFAFLLNGIHLDEVIFRYPKSGEKNAVSDAHITKPENTLGEYEFAAKPLLNWIKTNFPKTIVRIHDYSENMISTRDSRDESWVFNTNNWFQPGHADKHSHFHTNEHKLLADSGKKICALYGIDKPKMTIINDNWYLYFSDFQATHGNPQRGAYDNITTELFYWTPDLPEILIKQAHLIKQWFDMPENQQLKYLVQHPNHDVSKRTAYEQVSKSIIYPDYDLNTWQTSKPTTSFMNEMDYWFHQNFTDTKLYHVWEAGLDLLMSKIDPKYFSYEFGKASGLKAQLSPYYYIGPSNTAVPPAIPNRDYRKIPMILPTVKDKKLQKISL